ncbi:MAG: hypothetical protein GF372_13155 [Candidatus Marinimicrobia bacterium]|nr:hypothetical protein [Candidatus Neomarinimicrobiota bacterium]
MNLSILIQSDELKDRIQNLVESFVDPASELVRTDTEIFIKENMPTDMFITDYAYLQETGVQHFKNLKEDNPGSKTMVLHHAMGRQYAEDCFNAGVDYMIDSNESIDLIPEILTDLLNK